jgi:hypothetical protein
VREIGRGLGVLKDSREGKLSLDNVDVIMFSGVLFGSSSIYITYINTLTLTDFKDLFYYFTYIYS